MSIPNEAPVVPYASRLLDEHCAALVNEGDVRGPGPVATEIEGSETLKEPALRTSLVPLPHNDAGR